jgi:hypothetical protein
MKMLDFSFRPQKKLNKETILQMNKREWDFEAISTVTPSRKSTPNAPGHQPPNATAAEYTEQSMEPATISKIPILVEQERLSKEFFFPNTPQAPWISRENDPAILENSLQRDTSATLSPWEGTPLTPTTP